METVKFDLNQFLKSISFALDFVEIDILGASANHSRRVAYISNRLAEKLKLSLLERADITAFAIMHDNGLCEEVLHSQLSYKGMEQLQRMEGFKAHCNFGERNIGNYPLLSNSKDIVRYHHENYDGSGFFKLKGDEIPLLSQIIGLADFTDNYLHFERGDRSVIENFISTNRTKRFSPDLADCYLELSKTTKFWMDLQNEFINQALDQYTIPIEKEMTWQEILQITTVFSSIVDSKSKFTARHTKGIIDKAALAADFYKKEESEKYKLQIAASLHDLGKLAIPGTILEKNGPLDEREFNIIKSHTFYTKFALSQISLFSDIKEWAANHHEKLNGNGYPEGLNETALDFNSRLIACLDVYQALTEDRPYRKGMSYEKTLEIMRKMAMDKAIDIEIIDTLIINFTENDIR